MAFLTFAEARNQHTHHMKSSSTIKATLHIMCVNVLKLKGSIDAGSKDHYNKNLLECSYAS